jgi:peptide/nickel transport system substrate-binding protein
VARAAALAAAVAAGLLAVSGAGGAATQQTPKRGGTITINRPVFTEPACLNPFACTTVWFDPAVLQVLEGAYELDARLELRPNLVTHVETSRKPFRLTYHIRREARWSDGVPVTASDFLFTQRAFETVATPASPVLGELHRKVGRFRALDAKTFRVELREPFADWRDLYPVVLPRHALAGRDLRKVWIDGIDDPRTGRPIGSGPFLFASWKRGQQLTLVRNARYWGEHTAYLDRLAYRFTRPDPSDPLGPLRRDEFDVAIGFVGFISREQARQIRQTPGWRVLTAPGDGMEHLAFRIGAGGHPALENPLVRRAIAYAIDRAAITRAIQGELDRSDRKPLDSSVFLPTEPFYVPNWRGYRLDRTRARRLLRQAGCTRRATGVYSCAGEPLRLRLVTTPGDDTRSRVVGLVQAQLAAVGIAVEPSFAPISVIPQLLTDGQVDAALFSWGSVSGGVIWPEAICGNVQNWGGFCSRLLTRDAQQVDLIVDRRQRARILNAADRKLARAVPVLPVVQPVIRAAVRSTVRGVQPAGPFILDQNSEDWWLAAER